MKTADQVDRYIKELKDQGMVLSDVAWKAALACVGWPYVFGGRGQYCTPANRRTRYESTPDSKEKDKENIKAKCKNFNSTGSCVGCQFFPENQMTRFFDCRGFTYWILYVVYGWTLQGAGCTTQWNNNSNWSAKGKISDGIPKDTLVCLFYSKDNKEVTWEHTGFGFNDETVECAGTVYYKAKRDKKWTHWAVPKCVSGGDVPVWRPTIRKGSRGDDVRYVQQKLKDLGYDLGASGVDGIYGNKTVAAVKAFQKKNGLVADGVVGPMTYEALDKAVPDPGTETYYTVTIEHITQEQANEIKRQYPSADVEKEE